MKSILTFFVMLLFAFCIKAQTINGKVAAPQIVGAVTTPSVIAERPAQLIFEKVYLHTDRDVYAQGDTLWFKAYLVNAQDNKPITSSGNLYVELLAPDSAKIINREIIRLDKGLGNGDMELIDSLPSGKYRLRAYTNWMRNFGDNFAFEKNITILNTQAIPVAPDPKIAIKSKSKTVTKGKPNRATATSNTATTENKLPIVRFFPEGGSMVEGISSMVGIKAEDGYGSGIPVKGVVLSSAGDTVSRFSCDSLGVGLLALLPVKGQTYHAVVDPVPGSIPFRRGLVFDLPSALSKGLTLQIRQTDSVIRAIIRRSEDTTSDVAKLSYTVVVKNVGKTLLNQQLQLQTGQASAIIATALLPEGISAITLYDDQGKPQCERLVYVHHPGSVVKTSITTNKKVYEPKEQVSVQINAPANSKFSMAVVDAAIVPAQLDDIVSYLQLKSEVKGNIENARRYFDTANVNRFKQLDLLLMTQGWRDFVWRRLADTAIRISYAAENGINLPGRIWEEVRNKYLPNLTVSLHADSAKGTKLFSATTDSAGRFRFDGLMLYGKQHIQLASIDGKGKDRGSIMIDTILPLAVKAHISRPKGLQNLADSAATLAVEKRLATMKTSKLFGLTRLKEVTIKDKKTIMTRGGSLLTTFGYPDLIFNITPNDYQYKTLAWYMVQNVKGAIQSFYPAPEGIVFLGLDTLGRNRVAYTGIPPQLFINGQELYMDEYTQAQHYRIVYFNMPMNKFKKVVLKHMVGTQHGVNATTGKAFDSNSIVDRYLLYLTMQDNYTTDNPGFLNIDIPGYNQARAFYEPLPNAKPSPSDYRATIHWEPNIKTDDTGKATVVFTTACRKQMHG